MKYIIAVLLSSIPLSADLEKDYNFKGFTANYHRIVKILIDVEENRTDIDLKLYKDKASYDADPSSFIDMLSVDLKTAEFKTRDEFRDALKKTILYSGATKRP